MNDEVVERIFVSWTSLNVNVSGLLPLSAAFRNDGIYDVGLIATYEPTTGVIP
jgi:hypothetical protein